MSDTNAKNIGAVIINPAGPVHVTNKFGGDTPLSLPSNIPLAKGFIGREEELKDLLKAKQNGKTAFVLHGLGGVGKTELVLKFISEIRDEYQAHIGIDMRGLDKHPLSPKYAMLEIIRAFGTDIPAASTDREIKKHYIQLLNQHKTLIFFDNAKDRSQVEPLNQAAGLIIITSRNRFTVSGGFKKEIKPLSSVDARALLYSVADEERFEGQVDVLAQLTGYLPMALLPLASMLAEDITLEAAELIDKYSDRKERLLLADPNRENLTVEASFDLSYERLSDALKERWRKLAVFPSNFDVEAIRAIWQSQDVQEATSQLVKCHLLTYAPLNKRFRLHDLARDYTREKIYSDELSEVERLHAAYYGQICGNLIEGTVENLRRFDDESPNIKQGFDRIRDKVNTNDEIASLCLMYIAPSTLLDLRLNRHEFIRWFETGLSAARKINNKNQEIIILGNLGTAWLKLSEYQKATSYYEGAFTIAKEIGDHLNASTAIGYLGYAYTHLGQYRRAIPYIEQALAIAREVGDRFNEGARLAILGSTYLRLGEYRKAITYSEDALNIAREIGNRQGEGSSLGDLGVAYSNLGEYQKAIAHFEQSLAIAREFGNRLNEGSSLGNLGTAFLRLREYQESIPYFEGALSIARETSDRFGEGNSLVNLGSAYLQLGEVNKARDLLWAGWRILDDIRSPNAEPARRLLARMKSMNER